VGVQVPSEVDELGVVAGDEAGEVEDHGSVGVGMGG
jgi:hypothetical protein